MKRIVAIAAVVFIGLMIVRSCGGCSVESRIDRLIDKYEKEVVAMEKLTDDIVSGRKSYDKEVMNYIKHKDKAETILYDIGEYRARISMSQLARVTALVERFNELEE